MQKGMPIPCMKAENVRDVRRQVFCQNYDICLDQAIRKRWKGFSCERCPSFEPEDLSREQRNEEQTRCLALLYHCSHLDSDTLH